MAPLLIQKRIGMSINLPLDKRAAFIRPPRRNLGPLHSPKEKLCVPERPGLTLRAVHSPQLVHTNGLSPSPYGANRGNPHTSSRSAGCSLPPTQNCPADSMRDSRAHRLHP